jgi:DnaT-like ssDNA binding protein
LGGKGTACLPAQPAQQLGCERRTAGQTRAGGCDKIYGMLKELIEHGYAQRSVKRNGNGRVAGHEYIVHESKITPLPENPEVVIAPLPEKPDLVQPDLVKPTLINTDNKLILTVASSAQPLAIDWTPSVDVFNVLGNHGIDRGFIDSLIPEFIVYWRERDACAMSWNAKFVAQVLPQWRLHSSSTAARETPEQTFNRFFDRSWAEGLVANEIAAEGFLEGGDDICD